MSPRRPTSMTLAVAVQVVACRPWVPSSAVLRRWARAAHLAGATGGDRGGRSSMCVRIVGLAASRRLDRQFRGKDRPTNVLSFPASPEERASDGAIGDIVVCAPVVAAEARAQGKSLAGHWAHMVVHGTLHLLGYDHLHPRQARRMEALEVEILRGFGYQDPYLPVTSRPA